MSAAGALFARISALSRREKALLAACLLGIVAFTAAKWVVMPARAEYVRNRAAIPARRAVIARYEAFRQGQDRVDEELFDQVQRMEKWEDGLLVGETPSAAGVFLQGLLKPLTQRPETRVTSIRALPPVRKGRTPRWRCRWRSRPRRRGLPSCWPTSPGSRRSSGSGNFPPPRGRITSGQVPRKEVVAVSMVVAGLSAAPLDEKTPGRGEE